MQGRVVNLSHRIQEDMPVFPGDPTVKINQTSEITSEGFNLTVISYSTHVGTHIDFPSHIIDGGNSLNNYPAEKYCGNALLINCTSTPVIDHKLIEKQIENMPLDFILINSGWDQFWKSPQYFNSYPIFTKEAIHFLSSLPIKCIGIDFPSVDKPASSDYPNHRTFLANDILLIENLCNLGTIDAKHFFFTCFPLNLQGADGSPVTATAIINKQYEDLST